MRSTSSLVLAPAWRWIANLDDASGVDGEWSDGCGAAVTGLLRLAGEIYFPFLLANAEAVSRGAETFSVTLLGRTYTQGAFKYQVKCLAELRAAYARLDNASKTKARALLAGADCLKPLEG